MEKIDEIVYEAKSFLCLIKRNKNIIPHMAMLTGLEMQYTSNPKFINKNGRIIAYNVAIFLFSFVASSKRKTIKNKKLVKASDVIDNLYSKTYDKNCDERQLKDIVKKVIKKFFVRRNTSKQSDNVKIE